MICSPMLNSTWILCGCNFSGSEEEFTLVTCLIRQGTVVEKMMIKTSSFHAGKRLKIEAAMAKLQALQTKLTIKCF